MSVIIIALDGKRSKNPINHEGLPTFEFFSHLGLVGAIDLLAGAVKWRAIDVRNQVAPQDRKLIERIRLAIL
jgi:hypothetical protein